MACATLGIQLRRRSFMDRASVAPDGRRTRRLAWFLEPKSPCGRWTAGDIRKHWDDPAWQAANPEHPISIMWHFWQNLRAAEAHEPLCEEIVIRRGDKKLTVPKAWPRDRIEAALQKL